MHQYVLDQVSSRVTSHERKEAWLNILPAGPGYQNLYSWFARWKKGLARLEVTVDDQINAFDKAVTVHFQTGLKEVTRQQ